MHPFIKPSKREQLLELLTLCAELDSADELELLLMDICTSQELTCLAERWTIAKLLHMGFSYRTITKKTGASAATIARVSRLLFHGSGGLRQACLRRQQEIVGERGEVRYRLLDRPFTASI